MHSEETDTSVPPLGPIGHDHSLAQGVARVDSSGQPAPDGIGLRNPAVGALVLIAVAGSVASGLVPILGLHRVAPSQPPPAAIETRAVVAFPMPLSVEPGASQQRSEAIQEGNELANAATTHQANIETAPQENVGSLQLIRPSEVAPNQPPPAVIETPAVVAIPTPLPVEPGTSSQRLEAAPEGNAGTTSLADAVAARQGNLEATPGENAGFFQFIRPSELERAISGMMVPEPQKKKLRQEMIDGTTRLAWIIVSDSVDEDGDRIMIESIGYSQEVQLFHRPTSVAVPLKPGMPVTIRALVDGYQGGGITLAVHVHGGPLRLAPLAVGTTIQVPAQ